MHRILLIDDDQQLAAPLAAYLRRFDMQLESAIRPSDGLVRLRAEPFDAAAEQASLATGAPAAAAAVVRAGLERATNRSRSNPFARDSRDITVPMGTSRISAISS